MTIVRPVRVLAVALVLVLASLQEPIRIGFLYPDTGPFAQVAPGATAAEKGAGREPKVRRVFDRRRRPAEAGRAAAPERGPS